MAYSRDYPNSIIPKGSKVVECLQNDDKELKRILSILSDIGVMSLFGSKRQCVLHAATGTDGKPSYLTANGLNVAINGSTTPVIVAFAGGYDANGTVDKTDTIVDTVNAWTMPANGTYYLYIDKDMSTGILSYGYTTIPDTYATTDPESPTLDQCYFNTVEMKMYHYNGSAWVQVLRVFVAKAVTTASATTLATYPFASRATAANNVQYDSNGSLKIVDNTGTLAQVTASKFVGALTGNADTAAAADSAKHATSADTAIKATQDAAGNVISDNYIAMPNPLHNAGTHNALFRGRDITDYWTRGGMYADIAAGTFAGIYPGDYIRVPITVNGKTVTYDIVIGDCNYHLHRGDSETTTNHVLAFTRTHIGNEHMNATDTTAGGYIGSDMWKTILPKYTTAIKSAFGAGHILTHRELLSNAESDTVPSGAGAGWSGGTTGWGWYDVDVNLFNEPMVCGGKACSSSLFDVGDCNTQVAAMRHDKSLSFTRTYWCWLRAVVSSSCFAVAGNASFTDYHYASNGDGGVRVYFLLH